MAPLTWREVAAPNFSGVSESQRLAGTFLNNGFQSAIDAIGLFGKDQADREANALANEQTRTQTAGLALDNANQTLVNDQLGWTNDKTRAFEAGRPAAVDLVNQIRTAAALGTPEGRAEASRLQAAGSSIFANAGWTPDQVNAQINGNLGTNSAGLGLNRDQQQFIDENIARDRGIAADKRYAEALQAGGDPAGAANYIRSRPSRDPRVDELALAALADPNRGGLAFGPAADPATLILRQRVGTQGQGAAGADPLRSLITSTESGRGGYSALFGQSQEAGGAFAGTDVTRMTLDQMDAFDKNGYGDWVKGQVGRTATPAGMFQIVGDTRRQVAKELGLSGDTLFDQATQDAMFYHLVDKRISGPKSMDGKIASLRQEWEGFKKVPDSTLANAIAAYEGGDRGALSTIAGAGATASAGNSGSPVQAAFDSALSKQSNLTADENQALIDGGTALTNQAASILDSVTVDSMFGTDSLLSELVERPNRGKSTVETVNQMKQLLGDKFGLDEGELTAKLNELRQRYSLEPDMAAAFMMNAVQQNVWGTRWLLGETDINNTEFDRLVGTFYNKDGKTPDEKFKPAMEQLQARRTKQGAAAQLQQAQAQVDAAKQKYFTALQRKQNGYPQTDVVSPLLEYQALLTQMQKTINLVDDNPLLRSSELGKPR